MIVVVPFAALQLPNCGWAHEAAAVAGSHEAAVAAAAAVATVRGTPLVSLALKSAAAPIDPLADSLEVEVVASGP